MEIKKKLKGGVERAVQSSDYKNIYSAVIDTYTNNTVLKNFAEVGYWRRGQTVYVVVTVTELVRPGTVSRIRRVLRSGTAWRS